MIKKISHLLCLFICASTSHAVTIKYEVSGVITQADEVAFTSFSVGDIWSTTLYGNNPSSDLFPSNNSGQYQVDWTGQLIINGIVIPVQNVNYSTNILDVRLNNLSIPEVSLQVDFSNQILLDGIKLNNYHVDLMNTVTSSLNNDTYLGTLDYVQNAPFGGQVVLEFPEAGRQVVGSVNNVYISAVPIPTAVWLFGSGLICLIGFARRKASRNF